MTLPPNATSRDLLLIRLSLEWTLSPSCPQAVVRPVVGNALSVAVTDDFDHQIQLDRRPVLQQRRSRAPRVLISVAALAIIAGASAYLWLNYDSLFQAVSSIAHPAATPVVDSGEETVTLKDFQSFQRQTADSLQSVAQDIATQKTDLQSLSDQVSALAARAFPV